MTEEALKNARVTWDDAVVNLAALAQFYVMVETHEARARFDKLWRDAKAAVDSAEAEYRRILFQLMGEDLPT